MTLEGATLLQPFSRRGDTVRDVPQPLVDVGSNPFRPDPWPEAEWSVYVEDDR